MGRREAFDPLSGYVVNKPFAWGGQKLAAGTTFTDRRDMRRFRQLYDGRYLRKASPLAGAPTFATMKEPELREWLVARKLAALAHERTPKHRLVERCQRAWLAEQEGEPYGVATRNVPAEVNSPGVQGQTAERADMAAPVRKRERVR